MYTCINTSICVYMHTYIHVYIKRDLHIRVYLYIYVYMYTCMYICKFVYTRIFVWYIFLHGCTTLYALLQIVPMASSRCVRVFVYYVCCAFVYICFTRIYIYIYIYIFIYIYIYICWNLSKVASVVILNSRFSSELPSENFLHMPTAIDQDRNSPTGIPPLNILWTITAELAFEKFCSRVLPPACGWTFQNASRYGLAKTDKMPYLYKSYFAKELYN